MKGLLLGGIAAIALTTAAHAAPIAAGSELSLLGIDSFTATSIDFLGVAENVGNDSGDFSILAACVGCVTGNNFNSGSVNFVPYTVSDGGLTSDITLTSVSFDFTPGGPGGIDTLTITGSGIATLTGFDPTPGLFSLTTQGIAGTGNGTFTWSSTSLAGVPEPASLALLGTALVGLWGWRRRSSS